jgi:uncharacterized protein (UPF0333 family)
MLKKKAQAALEYLMTYGWAILVIVIVIAALYALGVFTPKASVACTPCFSSFAYLDHSYASNNFTLKIRNGARDITITGVTFNNGTDLVASYPTTVQANKDILIYYSPITFSTSSYDLTVNINYTLSETGLNHTDSAVLHGKI